jgi:hypothetical protein
MTGSSRIFGTIICTLFVESLELFHIILEYMEDSFKKTRVGKGVLAGA